MVNQQLLPSAMTTMLHIQAVLTNSPSLGTLHNAAASSWHLDTTASELSGQAVPK